MKHARRNVAKVSVHPSLQLPLRNVLVTAIGARLRRVDDRSRVLARRRNAEAEARERLGLRTTD